MFFFTNYNTRTLVVFLLSILFSHELFAGRALPEFSAQYGIEKFGIKVAEAHYQLHYTDTGYRFSQDTKLYGLARMFGDDAVSAVSLIDKRGDNLLLTKHEYTQTGREKNRNESFNIVWQTYKNTLKGNVNGVARGKEISLQTDSEVWEALSFQIPLMIEANSNIKEYPYKAILKGKIDTYNFVLTSIKKINYAGTEYKALQMVRTDPHKNRQLHIWLLPELNNIPFLIETYRKGKEDSRIQLESIQFNNDKPLVAQTQDDDDDDF